MANQPLTQEQLKEFNKVLEERIIEANQDKTKWKNVLSDLMAADIFVVAQPSDKTNEKGERLLNILSISDNAGHQAVPFFTSPNRMAVLANKEKTTFNVMKLNTVRFFQSIRGKTAILNPRSNAGKVFTPFEMNILVMENLDKLPKKTEAAASDAAETKEKED